MSSSPGARGRPARARSPGPRPATRRSPTPWPRRMTVAPSTTSGAGRLGRRRRVHQVPADRAGPARRRRPDDGGRVGERRPADADIRRRGEPGVATSARPGRGRRPRPVPAELGDPVDRDDRLGAGPCRPCRAATTRSVPPATGRASRSVGEDRERLVETVGRGGEPRRHRAPPTRRPPRPERRVPLPPRRRRRSRSPARRAPASSAGGGRGRRSPPRSRSRRRPAVGTIGGSPTPFEPRGPPFDAGCSTKIASMLGRVGAREQLVVEQRRVPLPAVVAVPRPLERRVAEGHHDPAGDLADGRRSG